MDRRSNASTVSTLALMYDWYGARQTNFYLPCRRSDVDRQSNARNHLNLAWIDDTHRVVLLDLILERQLMSRVDPNNATLTRHLCLSYMRRTAALH